MEVKFIFWYICKLNSCLISEDERDVSFLVTAEGSVLCMSVDLSYVKQFRNVSYLVSPVQFQHKWLRYLSLHWRVSVVCGYHSKVKDKHGLC